MINWYKLVTFFLFINETLIIMKRITAFAVIL